ncbi:hypothetical protein ScPMuIL_017879 [Solemya velum]
MPCEENTCFDPNKEGWPCNANIKPVTTTTMAPTTSTVPVTTTTYDGIVVVKAVPFVRWVNDIDVVLLECQTWNIAGWVNITVTRGSQLIFYLDNTGQHIVPDEGLVDVTLTPTTFTDNVTLQFKYGNIDCADEGTYECAVVMATETRRQSTTVSVKMELGVDLQADVRSRDKISCIGSVGYPDKAEMTWEIKRSSETQFQPYTFVGAGSPDIVTTTCVSEATWSFNPTLPYDINGASVRCRITMGDGTTEVSAAQRMTMLEAGFCNGRETYNAHPEDCHVYVQCVGDLAYIKLCSNHDLCPVITDGIVACKDCSASCSDGTTVDPVSGGTTQKPQLTCRSFGQDGYIATADTFHARCNMADNCYHEGLSSVEFDCVLSGFLYFRGTTNSTDPSVICTYDYVESYCYKEASGMEIPDVCAAGATVMPHPRGCQLFYDCGITDVSSPISEAYVNECEYPMLFSTVSLSCEIFDGVTCGDRQEFTNGCDYEKNSCDGTACSCAEEYPSCDNSSDGSAVFVGKEWTPAYITCRGGRLIEKNTCENDTDGPMIFDPDNLGCKNVYHIPQNQGGKMPDCDNKVDGKYPDEDGVCDYYIQCTNGAFIDRVMCSDGSVFSISSKQCELKENVCGDCGTKTDCGGTTQKPQLTCLSFGQDGYIATADTFHTRCNMADQCFHQGASSIGYNCLPGLKYFRGTTNSTDPSVICTNDYVESYCYKEASGMKIPDVCAAGATVMPHPRGCQLFYDCGITDVSSPISEAYVNECEYPKLFSTVSLSCEIFDGVTCGDRQEFTNGCDYEKNRCDGAVCSCAEEYPSCDNSSDGSAVFRGKEWTPAYITCRSGRLIEKKTCENDNDGPMIFDPDNLECKNIYHIPQNQGGKMPDCDNKVDGKYPDEDGDCDYYVQCTSGAFIDRVMCPDGSVFSISSEQCELKENVCGVCGTDCDG